MTALLLALALLGAPDSMADSMADPMADPAAAGRKIDIELQDAEIHDVLDLFADIGHVNIVTAKGIEGRVTAKFYDTPWDTVLAHVLAGHRKSRFSTTKSARNAAFLHVREDKPQVIGLFR